MVARNVWGSNLRRFAAAATGVMIGLLSQMLRKSQQPRGSVATILLEGGFVCDNIPLRKRNKPSFGVTKMEQSWISGSANLKGLR
jgi:hypothetical protein